MNPWPRPTSAELKAAATKRVPDLIAPNLKVLFVGINPGLYTAAIGRHFGRPGNRFWPAMFAGGFTSRLLSPFEGSELLASGYGISNLVERATNAADELSRDELIAGAKRLGKTVRKYRPRMLAILGIGSYRVAFEKPKAVIGEQPDFIAGAPVWVLPNPSGLNAHFVPKDLARLFLELRVASERNR